MVWRFSVQKMWESTAEVLLSREQLPLEMKSILISWLTEHLDLIGGESAEQSLVAQFHRHFWQHERHVLLYVTATQADQAQQVADWLQLRYPQRQVELRGVMLPDPEDLYAVKNQVEGLLLQYRDLAMDLLFRSGNATQQLVWYLVHQSLGLKSRLVHWRVPRDRRQSPRLQAVEVMRDSAPYTAIIRQQAVDQPREKPQLTTTAMMALYRRAYRIGQSEHARVLIRGASGTGKTHLARYLHQQSPRAQGPFLAFNCGALTEADMADRLFGDGHTPGLLREAAGGTLLLDEIEQLSLGLQLRLGQVIRSQTVQPTDWSSPQPINVRLLTAASTDLLPRCEAGTFRWDLYYLLAVVELEIPSLYERGAGEIERLTDFFLHEKKALFQRKAPLRLGADVRRRLEAYHWPGNVRELENVIEHLYIFCDEQVEIADLPRRFQVLELNTSESWRDVEARHLRRVYERYNRNKSRTCRALGYGSINTLKKKLREYGIEGEEPVKETPAPEAK